MLLPAPTGSERAQALAAKLGCTVGEFSPSFGHMKPALLGSMAGFSATLAEFGGRFERRDKVYVFANWPTVEAALQHVIDQEGPPSSARGNFRGNLGGCWGVEGDRLTLRRGKLQP